MAEAITCYGIDIRKPLELALPYIENDKIIYSFTQYIWLGNGKVISRK